MYVCTKPMNTEIHFNTYIVCIQIELKQHVPESSVDVIKTKNDYLQLLFPF